MTHYSTLYERIPLNSVDIPQSVLDIRNKTRSNPLKWSGQFSPQFVHALLQAYGTNSARVYDPFLGSGTVLLEAGRLGIAACGSEINPAAVTLARTYEFINIRVAKRRKAIKLIETLLEQTFPLSIFIAPPSDNGYCLIEQKNVIRQKLLALHQTLSTYLSTKLIETLIILVDFHKKEDLSVHKIFKVWNKLKQLVLELPYNLNQIDVFHSDARNTPVPNSTIDLVITSPPYINVFNYHQQYRRSAESLQWNLLEVAKSEFGSNRKHRGNRFLTVTQFCLDIAHTLNELIRISTDSARLIFVVGRESKVRGTTFYNSAIFTELACQLGYTLLMRQERKFKNRFGKWIYEDIIHLELTSGETFSDQKVNDTARRTAFSSLNGSLSHVPDNAVQDLMSAIDKIPYVQSSPILNKTTILKNEVLYAN